MLWYTSELRKYDSFDKPFKASMADENNPNSKKVKIGDQIFLTKKASAEYHNVHTSTILNWVKAGKAHFI